MGNPQPSFFRGKKTHILEVVTPPHFSMGFVGSRGWVVNAFGVDQLPSSQPAGQRKPPTKSHEKPPPRNRGLNKASFLGSGYVGGGWLISHNIGVFVVQGLGKLSQGFTLR